MELKEFKEKLFKNAEEASFSEYEIYYEEGESLEIQAFKKEIDKYSFNKTLGISFRALYKGKMGYAYTEIMDDDAIELLINKARDNAETIENEETEIIFAGSIQYEIVNVYNRELEKIDASENIKLALELEAETYNYSPKVTNTCYCLIGSERSEKRIINSKGLNLSHKVNSVVGVIGAVVEEDGKTNNAYAYKLSNDLKDINIKDIAKESVDEALAYFGAKPVKSGKYKIMLKNSMSTDLLQTFSGIFTGDNAQKGLSLLKGKVGQKIAFKNLTLIDNPLTKASVVSSPFDAEGVATYEKNVIENGILKTLLHNLKTAAKEGIETTGNAAKASYTSPVEVAPSNLYIKPSETSYADMIKTLGAGIIITEMMGMHSGANAVSGDFSLAAKGFLVENGKIVRPVEQITVAGNYLELLKNVEKIGGDFKFELPSGSSCFGSPSIIIRELSVAGE